MMNNRTASSSNRGGASNPYVPPPPQTQPQLNYYYQNITQQQQQQQQQSHVRQPQTTLFEDSPEASRAYGRLMSGGRGVPQTTSSSSMFGGANNSQGAYGRTSRDNTFTSQNVPYHQTQAPRGQSDSNYQGKISQNQYSNNYGLPQASTAYSAAGAGSHQRYAAPTTSQRPASHNLYSNEHSRRAQALGEAPITNNYVGGSSRYPGLTSPPPQPSGVHSTASSRQQHLPSSLSSVHHDGALDQPSASYGVPTYEGAGPSEEHKAMLSASIHDELMMDQHHHGTMHAEDGNNNGDVEIIIMNLYSKMKNLEGKYIDLANFYKQELVKSNKKPSAAEQRASAGPLSPRSPGDQTSARWNNEVGPRLTDRSDQNQPIGSSRQHYQGNVHATPGKGTTTPVVADPYLFASERQIINDLVEEKKKLEEDLKLVMAMRNNGGPRQSVSPMQSSAGARPPILSDFKNNIPTKEQLHFLNQQLAETLTEVLENIEGTQKRALNYLSGKQNEMYQLATSRTYNFPPQVKNEALGLWYDSKTKISALLGDLKSQITQKKSQIENNIVSSKINSTRVGKQANTFLDNLEAVAKSIPDSASSHDETQLTVQSLESIRKELNNLKKKHDHHVKAVQKLRNSFLFKETMIREEQNKIQHLIRDMLKVGNMSHQSSGMVSGGPSQEGDSRNNPSPMTSQNNGQQNSRRSGEPGLQNQRLTSNDRAGPGMMSPFEKKIASYQKSAEKRKQGGQDRSGSRSRPAQSQMAQTIGDPYGVSSNEPMHDAHELKVIRSRIRQLDNIFEDFTGKLLVKGQDAKDMDRQVDSLFAEISKHANALDLALNSSTSAAQSASTAAQTRNRSKNRGEYLQQAQSPSFKDPQQQKKVTELLKSNDQLYGELQKTNERYLNQRVENAKLKDEIQILQAQLEGQLQSSSKLANLSRDGAQSPITGSRQQIKLKSRPSRHEGSLGPNTSGSSQQPAQRTTSNTSNIVARENEDLKKRIRDLEKECFQLTYYQQELQRRGGFGTDQVSRENQDIRHKMEQICLQVSQFLLAMRRLQRAVNNKDKDIQELKAEFERNKKALEIMVKEAKEEQAAKKNASSNHNNSIASGGGGNPSSLQASTDKLGDQQRFSSQDGRAATRNKSQGPHGVSQSYQNTPTQQVNQTMTSAVTQRNDPDQSSHSLLPPKKASIRPKQQKQQNVDGQEVQLNLTNPDFTQVSNNLVGQTTLHMSQEQDHFNSLQEEIKQLSEESDRLRTLVRDTQQANLDLSTQVQAQQAHSSHCERLIGYYKDALEALEGQVTDVDIGQLRQDLIDQESQLQHFHSSGHPRSLGCTNHGSQTEISGDFTSVLKHQVAQLIAAKEEELEAQMRGIYQRVEQKEEEVANLKKLFVEKLRELESSFVELSQDMIETEVVQQEAITVHSKKSQMALQAQQNSQNQRLQLERSLEQALVGHHNDSHDSQLEQLAVLNEQLTDENRELREHIKQLEKELEQGATRELDSIRAQFEEMQEANESMAVELQNARSNREADKITLDQLKRLNERLRAETSEEIKSKDRQIEQQLKKLNDYHIKVQGITQQLSEAQDVRAILEIQLEKQKTAIQDSDTQVEPLRDHIKALEVEVSGLQQELALLKSLKSGGEAPAIDASSEEARIDKDPIQAAHHFLKLLRTVQKEYRILKNAQDRLQFNFDELRDKCEDIKLDARESAQEVMNMEGIINDLRDANEKLTREVEQTRGHQQSSEQEIIAAKKQVEDEFRAKLGYKETELADLTTKLGRISQSNIDFKTRCERLEAANVELSSELEQHRTRVSALEMELEMTKENADHDFEKQIELVRAELSEQVESLRQQLTSKDAKVAELSDSLTDVKDTLEAKLARKREKLLGLRGQVESLDQDLANLRQSHKDLQLECETAKADRDDSKTQKMESERKALHLETQLEAAKRQVGEYEANFELAQTQAMSSFAAKAQEFEKHLSDVKKEAEQTRLALAQQKEEALDALTNQVSTLRSQLEESQQQQRDLVQSMTEQQDAQTQELLAQKEADILRLANEVKTQTEHALQLQKDLRHLRENLQKITLEMSEAQSKLGKTDCLLQESQALLEHTQKVLERTKADAEEREASLTASIDTMRLELTQAIQQARDAQDQINNLEVDKEDLQSQLEASNIVKAALQQDTSRLQADFTAQLESQTKAKDEEIEVLKVNQEKEMEIFKQAEAVRFEDIKKKSADSLAEMTQEYMVEIAKIQETHSKEIESQHQSLVDSNEVAQAALRNEHESQVAALRAEQDQRFDEIRRKSSDGVKVLTQQFMGQMTDLQEEHEQEMEAQEAAHKQTLFALTSEHDSQLQALQSQLTTQQDEQIQYLIAQKQTELEAAKGDAQNLKEVAEKLGGLLKEKEELAKTQMDEIQHLQDQVSSLGKDQEASKARFKEENEGLKAHVKKLEEEVEQSKRRLSVATEKGLAAEARIAETLEEMQRLKSQASGANNEIEGLVQELEAHVQDLTSQLEDLKEQLADKDEILQKHKGHIGKLSADIKDLKAVHAIDLETQMNQLTKRYHDDLDQLIEEHRQELLTSQAQTQGEYEAQLNEMQEAMNDQAERLAALESIEGECQIIREENGDFASKVGELEQQNENLQARIKELISELDEARRSQSESENEQIKSLTSKMTALEAQRDSAVTKTSAMERTSNELQEILHSKEKEMDAQGRDLEQAYLEIADKEREWLEERDRMLRQIEEMRDEVISETERMLAEKDEVEARAHQQVQDLTSALETLDTKLSDLTAQLIDLKKDQKVVSQIQKLTESLLEAQEEQDVVGELGSENIQYCKRVKYLEKVWILISNGDSRYVWLDQELIPYDQLKDIQVLEDAAAAKEKQDGFQRKLEELLREKDQLAKAQSAILGSAGQISTPRSQYSSDGVQQQLPQSSDYQLAKTLEIENAQLRQDTHDLKKLINNLQQSLVQSKARVSELGEVIIRLTESDGGQNDALSMMASSKQDFKKKYYEQVELNTKYEQENEALRRQVIELTDLSFAKGFQSQGALGSARGDRFDVLNASSIMGDDDHIDVGLASETEKVALQDRVATLEDEVQKYRHQLENLQSENQELKTNNSQEISRKHDEDEELENFRHVKNLFIQFLEATPMQASKKEDLLPVIFSMLQVSKDEVNKIKKSRESLGLSQSQVKDAAKKGVFGMFKK